MSDFIENESTIDLPEMKKKRGRPPKKETVEELAMNNLDGTVSDNIGNEEQKNRYHLVKEGECLMSIATMEYGDYRKSRLIREANNIIEGVKVGQVLVIP